ncbi:selT/selW/selH selenoprotein, partial [Opisthorchis viverrini]
YRRVFEELSRIVVREFPSLKVEGEIYPPPAWRNTLAKVFQLLKFSLIILAISGIDPFSSLGLATPSFLTYAFQNKVSFCLTAFLIGNLIEGQLLSTGAFEIYYNDMPIWSKLDSNRIPQPHELLDILNNQMKFKPTFAHGASPQAIPPS